MRLDLSRFSRRRLALVAVGTVAVAGVAVLPTLPAFAATSCNVTYNGAAVDRGPERRRLHRQHHRDQHRRPVDVVDPAVHPPQRTVVHPGLVGQLDRVRHGDDRARTCRGTARSAPAPRPASASTAAGPAATATRPRSRVNDVTCNGGTPTADHHRPPRRPPTTTTPATQPPGTPGTLTRVRHHLHRRRTCPGARPPARSPTTRSSAARAAPVRTSPRSAPRPPTSFSNTGLTATPRTGSGCGRPTRPATPATRTSSTSPRQDHDDHHHTTRPPTHHDAAGLPAELPAAGGQPVRRRRRLREPGLVAPRPPPRPVAPGSPTRRPASGWTRPARSVP